LNDWIIKAVEKVMFKDRSDARWLEEILENLVQDIVENNGSLQKNIFSTAFWGLLENRLMRWPDY